MTAIKHKELPDGYYWFWRDDEWELCYKNSYGIDSIEYPDWGTESDFDSTLCVPVIKPPHP
tara:strand:- start:1925 stop:2107 length:183 start_codon:yes stop_codon:yes gene_type:complete